MIAAMREGCAGGRPRGTHWGRVAAVVLGGAVLATVLIAVSGPAPVVVTFPQALAHAAASGVLAGWVLPRARRRLAGWAAPLHWGLLAVAALGLAGTATATACAFLTATGLARGDTLAACAAGSFGINAILTVTISLGMTLYGVQRARLDAVTLDLRTAELERERASTMALEARLGALESRLQPHFLFNTLNAISALIQADPERAERTVERLAALMRFSLDAAQRGLIPLAEELTIVGDYLEIERTRLGERLAYALQVEPEVTACAIPPLAVQTLVENAVKHAIAPRPGGGRVRVEAAAVGDDVVLSVWDDGPGFAAEALRPGHGLDNLRGRLGARYGPRARLTIGQRDGGTLVTVSLPRTSGARP
jgi:signal transduction histidine kinase